MNSSKPTKKQGNTRTIRLWTVVDDSRPRKKYRRFSCRANALGTRLQSIGSGIDIRPYWHLVTADCIHAVWSGLSIDQVGDIVDILQQSPYYCVITARDDYVAMIAPLFAPAPQQQALRVFLKRLSMPVPDPSTAALVHLCDYISESESKKIFRAPMSSSQRLLPMTKRRREQHTRRLIELCDRLGIEYCEPVLDENGWTLGDKKLRLFRPTSHPVLAVAWSLSQIKGEDYELVSQL